MANYKGHLFVGTLFFLISLYAFSFYCAPTLLNGLEWFLFSLAGSLFPDVDVKSKGQNYFYWIVFGLLVFLAFMKRWRLAAYISIVSMVPLLVHHRGLCHRIWFVSGVPLLIALAFSSYVPHYTNRLLCDALFFVIGAISHLWLDLGLRKMLRI